MDKKKSILIQAIVVLAIIGVGVGVYTMVARKPAPTVEQQPLLGGDKDVHGCIGSAGYSWCEVKQKCLRIWEEKCEAAKSSTPTSTSTKPSGVTEPSAWKTYTSDKYGFVFQYPSLSTVTLATSSSSVATTVVVKLKDANLSYSGNGRAISFQVYEKGGFVQYSEASQCKSFERTTLTIDGKTMDIVEHEKCKGEEGVISSTHYTHALISLSDKEDIVFTASLGSFPFGQSELVNTILKTFKFVPRT